jgi:cysteine desulfurase
MIYLDHNATTPTLPEVLEAMLPYLQEDWGNPSSPYRFGAKLKRVVETAREQAAALVGADPMDLIFTSGGTESNNTALHAISRANTAKRHIITSAVEHSAVLNHCRFLEMEGYRVTYLPVDSEGVISMADLEASITSETAGVSLMWANNETGVLFPVEQIASVCQARGVLFHCDAVQATGKVAMDISRMAIDYLAVAGHKIGAPKGVGALYVRRKAPFTSFVHGGQQESGRRGGTESLPLIVGLGVASEHTSRRLPDYSRTLKPLRDALEVGLLSTTLSASLNGHPIYRLANTTNVHFAGSSSEVLLTLLDKAGICASSGAACSSGTTSPSHVITAMKGRSAASESIRFSLGFNTTPKDIEAAIQACAAAVRISSG